MARSSSSAADREVEMLRYEGDVGVYVMFTAWSEEDLRTFLAEHGGESYVHLVRQLRYDGTLAPRYLAVMATEVATALTEAGFDKNQADGLNFGFDVFGFKPEWMPVERERGQPKSFSLTLPPGISEEEARAGLMTQLGSLEQAGLIEKDEYVHDQTLGTGARGTRYIRVVPHKEAESAEDFLKMTVVKTSLENALWTTEKEARMRTRWFLPPQEQSVGEGEGAVVTRPRAPTRPRARAAAPAQRHRDAASHSFVTRPMARDALQAENERLQKEVNDLKTRLTHMEGRLATFQEVLPTLAHPTHSVGYEHPQ